MIFLCFAAAYIAFLIMQIGVEQTFQIRNSISSAVENPVFHIAQPDGDFLYQNLHGANTPDKVARWLNIPLVEMAFGTADTNSSTTCIHGYNCILSGKAALMRMTVRRWALKPNPDTELGTRISPFVLPESLLNDGSMYVTNTSLADEYVKYDTNHQLIQPTGLEQDQDFERACNYQKPGNNRGFDGKGGWVCILSDNEHDFKKTIGTVSNMLTAPLDPIQPYMIGSVIVEFITYNANVDMTTFVRISFDSDGTGKMIADLEIFSINIKEYVHITDWITLIPGLIYFALVVFYTYDQIRMTRNEYIRKSYNEGTTLLQCVIEHFKDPYNVCDCASIFISTVSMIIFIIFTFRVNVLSPTFIDRYNTAQVDVNKAFDEFTTFVWTLNTNMLTYSRMSSLNVIFICLRALKFVRHNSRVNKLMATLNHAVNDIWWFSVLLSLFLFGFVSFVHIAFGTHLYTASTVFNSILLCFLFLIGTFDYPALVEVDPV